MWILLQSAMVLISLQWYYQPTRSFKAVVTKDFFDPTPLSVKDLRACTPKICVFIYKSYTYTTVLILCTL